MIQTNALNNHDIPGYLINSLHWCIYKIRTSSHKIRSATRFCAGVGALYFQLHAPMHVYEYAPLHFVLKCTWAYL